MDNPKSPRNRLKRMIGRTKKIRFNINISPSRSKEAQLRTLKKLVQRAQDSAFGKEYGFKSIAESEDIYGAFSSKVPYGDYLNMLPWWTRAREGETDVTWPGKVQYFALSSGTSDGSSKYIPVTSEMLKYIRRASLRQILAVAATDVPKDHITKHWLMVGGSTSLDFNGIYHFGDLSGITTANIPAALQRISKPEPDIRSSKDWKNKIERITKEAENWDVGMIAGVPAWIQLLFENIIAHYKLNNIHDIWPNLEVYMHGGVSLKPYRKSIDKLLGRPIKYFETYLASEGFIALQTRQNKDSGMRLLVRNGIFFEFVPFNDKNFNEHGELSPNAEIYPLWEISEGEEYALLLSTCSGAWRYLIGDTIKFTKLKKNELIITGRTKHFISLCGEHLSVDNMNQAVQLLGEKYNAEFNEFTVGGISVDNLFGHQWFLPETGQNLDPVNIAEDLDKFLCELNDDYAVERKHALKAIKVQFVPDSSFIGWLNHRGKMGAQSKFPRVLKGKLLENWKSYLIENGVDLMDFEIAQN